MTPEEQLKKWVQGNSIHNTERDECCPDFSCCRPELMADEETRLKFAKAHLEGDDDTKMRMLYGFMGELLKITENAHKVHVIE